MDKPKISTDWLCGCSGCHMSLLDMDERIIQIAELADIRSTPITDLKVPDADGVDVGVLEGAINNTYNEEVALRMRSHCKVLVALGDCAVFGGIPAMRNLFPLQEAMQRAYVDAESNDGEAMIPSDPELADMTQVRALQDVVPVDIFVPGCPPDADVIYYVLSELAQGRKPVLSVQNGKLMWK